MNRVLIVITRQGEPNEIGPGELYPEAKEYASTSRRIIVIQGIDLDRQDPNTGAIDFSGFNTKVGQLRIDQDDIGVAVHCSAADVSAWKMRFGAKVARPFQIGRYSSDGMDTLYAAHQGMATAFQGNDEAAKARSFDTFWNLCFMDRVLEDLILLLQTHARKKSEGEPIDDLDTLKTAVAGNGQGQPQGNGRSISNEAIELVSPRLTAGTGYDGLRMALVESVVARYENPSA